MHFETIIFLLIAFNVVTAALKRRARKAAKLREQNSSESPQDGSLREEKPSDRAARSPAEAPPNTTPPNRNRPEPEPGSMGKDLLDQLAQEFGLKIPRPAPTPPIRRSEIPTLPPIPPTLNPKFPATAQPAARAQPAAPAAPAAAVTSVLPVPAVPTAAISTAQTYAIAPLRFAAGLRDTRSLREAMVLKEILDRPVALRRN